MCCTRSNPLSAGELGHRQSRRVEAESEQLFYEAQLQLESAGSAPTSGRARLPPQQTPAAEETLQERQLP